MCIRDSPNAQRARSPPLDCGGMAPLWLHAPTAMSAFGLFEHLNQVDGEGKAVTCPRSPKRARRSSNLAYVPTGWAPLDCGGMAPLWLHAPTAMSAFGLFEHLNQVDGEGK